MYGVSASTRQFLIEFTLRVIQDCYRGRGEACNMSVMNAARQRSATLPQSHLSTQKTWQLYAGLSLISLHTCVETQLEVTRFAVLLLTIHTLDILST